MLGEYYKAIPDFSKCKEMSDFVRGGKPKGKVMTGKCIYVHPKGRFITLQFPFGRRVLRESFHLDEVQPSTERSYLRQVRG